MNRIENGFRKFSVKLHGLWSPRAGVRACSPVFIFLASIGGGISGAGATEAAAPAVSSDTYAGWSETVSNWGRWGKEDQLGTLNFITPEKRIAAAGLVREGVSVSMALPLNKQADALNANPFEHELEVSAFGGHEVAGDRYSVQYHGFAHSHMDGLPPSS